MHFPDIRILHRKTLSETLREATQRYRLIVLSAPMGYGKTTAIRELLPTLPQRTFYTAITPGLHGPHYLWDRSCSQIATQGSRLAPTLLQRGFPSTPGEVEQTLDLIREHLRCRPTVLVYDDYHYLNTPAMNAFYELFTRADIEDLCLVLITRTRPSLKLDELCLKRFAIEYDKSLLAFSRSETQAFFKLHGVDDPAIADAAWAYSEGWPSALWLSMQSYLAHGVLTPERTVENLLESVVFSPYSAEDRRLLLHLSLMPRFSPRQAAHVMDDVSVPRKLMALHESNAFLNYDPATDCYSLHTLFRNFLQRQLENVGSAACPIDIPAVYRRIAQWHAKEGEEFEAIKMYAVAGSADDLLDILRIFEKPGDGHLVRLAPERIRSIFNSIPWSIRFLCPIGYLAFLYHYMSRVNITEGIPLLEEAERRFMAEESIPAPLKRRIEGELMVIKGIRAFNDIAAMHALRAKAHALLSGHSSIMHKHMYWNFGCPSVSFLYLRTPGSYADLIRRVQSHTGYYQELADGCSMGAQDLTRAEYYLEKARFKLVETHAGKAIYRANSKTQRTTILCANFTLARMHIARGRPENVSSLMDEMNSQYGDQATSLLAVSMEIARGYLNACLERPDSIPNWLKEGQPPTSSNIYHGAPFAHIIQGKCLMLKKNWVHLEVFAQDMPQQTAYRHLLLDIHAGILEAVASYHLDGVDRAADFMARALDLARPDGLSLCIAEYGRHVLPLLRRHMALSPTDVFAEGILRLAKRYAEAVSLPESATADTAQTGLKEREITLLSLASQGKSNNEIARRLKLSEAAIKKSFSAIYRKLHVRNRAEAVQAFAILKD